jgi:hypothetical protein
MIKVQFCRSDANPTNQISSKYNYRFGHFLPTIDFYSRLVNRWPLKHVVKINITGGLWYGLMVKVKTVITEPTISSFTSNCWHKSAEMSGQYNTLIPFLNLKVTIRTNFFVNSFIWYWMKTHFISKLWGSLRSKIFIVDTFFISKLFIYLNIQYKFLDLSNDLRWNSTSKTMLDEV